MTSSTFRLPPPSSLRSPGALPSRVRDYELWGRLGEGGMSDVWLAKHTVLAVPVILKTVKASLDAEEHARPRVIEQARLMARVRSPRVVHAIDAGLYEGVPYLVEEYVDGVDMAELDRRRRASLGVGLPLWFVARAMHEACDALHAAHQAGVVHCDVKPSNLLAGTDLAVRLGDFGIAVRQEGERRQIAGTLRFIAPEQLQRGELSRRTDVWGAAATAYDLRYGTPPFTEIPDLLDAEQPARFPPPQSAPEAYFQHLLSTMLQKSPEARLADVAQASRQFGSLAQALEGVAEPSLLRLDRATLQLGSCVIALSVGDLADAEADAIVSSANYSLSMRTGSADALRRRGGDAIEEEAQAGGERPLGTCISTAAGALHARHVLHAVSAWNETSCIGRATQRALLLADELGHRSLAVPALGTGVAGVTLETCASSMMSALRSHLRLGGTRLRRVDVVLGDEQKLRVFRDVAEEELRARAHRSDHVDLGLPVQSGAVRVEGGTFVDPSTRSVP